MTSIPASEAPLASYDVDGGTFSLRRARRSDLPAILGLLAADQLRREDGSDLAPYERAFDAIDADPAHLLVAGGFGGAVVATFQLSFLPGLSRRGSWRAQIEAVRVSEDLRGRGLGALMIGWAVGEAKAKGCSLVQLTTDKSRTDAHRFYERLGFVASHEGMKLAL